MSWLWLLVILPKYLCMHSNELLSDPEKYKTFENIDPKLMHKGINEQEQVVDLVCGMKGKPEDWIEYEYKGKNYYFCKKR